MTFLEAFDSYYKDKIIEYQLPEDEKEFLCFFTVILRTNNEKYIFEVQKDRNKAKFFFLEGKQRVYLSDVQIIQTILKMDDKDIDWFIAQFVSFYQGKTSPYVLEFMGEEYQIKGISLYPVDKELLLMSDTKISFQSFCVLLSFIFAKDYNWEAIGGPKRRLFQKSTLTKFISIIDYHHSKSDCSKNYLEKIGALLFVNDINNVIEVGKLKNIFVNTNSLEMFDISVYL